MNRPLRPLKKLPYLFKKIRISLNKNKFNSVNLYFQDESRFGLMTHTGRCLTAKGIKPLVTYKHAFKSTYLYGSFSPINGDSFIWEINGVDTIIFEAYLQAFSNHNPKELKLVVIDNAGFHSTKNITIPDNIILINIPPYSPELNPSEKIWQYIKQRFKNQTFNDMRELEDWIQNQVNKLSTSLIKSITHMKLYNNEFMRHFVM